MKRARPTLAQVFLLTIAGLAALLGILFFLLFDSSRRSILESAERRRTDAARRVVDGVLGYLNQAQRPLADIELEIQHGAWRADDPLAVEANLFREVLTNPGLAEATLTHAVKLGYDASLEVRLAPAERWQVSVFRTTADAGARIVTHSTHLEGGRFVVDVRERPAGAALLDVPLTRSAAHAVPDPTEHLTFKTTVSTRFYGETLWSDLHPSEMDEHLPQPQQRIVVTAMKAVEDRQKRFVGVLRVGLLREQLEQGIQGSMVNRDDPSDAHRVLLCDEHGRLVTRLTPRQRMDWFGEDYRVVPEGLPPEIVAALAHPALRTVAPGENAIQRSGDTVVDGRRYLLTFRGLGRTQGWRVGIVVPEDYYLGPLRESRDRLLRWAALVMLAILLGGVVTVRIVQRGLGRIVATTARMRRFDFAPAEHRSSIKDIHDVMLGLELAKTALRAMGKYVPIDLVRLLYQTGREPVLGGELARVSLLFSDIKDFTSLSERLTPNELAQVLGRYLEAMTAAVHGCQGTIDKYIGDAIMAVWNVPTPCSGHALKACEAALACVQAGETLFASAAWGGRPALVTRFGLHTDEVMVGHFGAPDRMSFTSLGDGVNLASRLEGLNKQYGTTILASQAIFEEAKQAFAFRLVDLVAVKGKTKGVRVYELLGAAGCVVPGAVERYGEALEAYSRREFATALRLVEGQDGDSPSRVLAERCRRLLDDPPPPDWDGIYVAHEK